MKFVTWLKRLLRLDELEEVTTLNFEDESGKMDEYKPYDYGRDVLEIALRSNDYRWSSPYPNVKRVILTNPLECAGRITVFGMASLWRGTGHSEWEFLLADLFVGAVEVADENWLEEIEITHLFNRDLYNSDRSCEFTKEQIFNHLMLWFDVQEESDEEIRVSFKVV